MKRAAWASYRGDGIAWFRVFGFGLHWKDAREVPLTFSERYGYARKLVIGPWRIGVLTP